MYTIQPKNAMQFATEVTVLESANLASKYKKDILKAKDIRS